MVTTLAMVANGASVASMINGNTMAAGFKLSELLSKYKHMTKQEVASFVTVTIVTTFISVQILFNMIMGLYSHEAE